MRRVLFVVVVVACKRDVAPAPAPSASVTTPPAPSAADVSSRIEYAGTYAASPGTLYVPDAAGFEGFKYRGDDAGVAVGGGTLSFTVATDGGGLVGEMEGPLGPATLSGVASGHALTFQVTPAQASVLQFTGTGTGVVDGGAVSGEMHLSSWHGNVLRDATFQVASPPAQRPPR